MDNTYFARARALMLAKSVTDSHLLWAAFQGGDHIFLTHTGREVRVDLVIGRVTCEPGVPTF